MEPVQTRYAVGVYVPDECQRVSFVIFNAFQLCFELEAVVVCVINEGNVADLLIR